MATLLLPFLNQLFDDWLQGLVGDCIGAGGGSLFGDDVACERPMADRCDHVFADAELGDGVFVCEGDLVDVVKRVGTVVDFFEPHLAQRERLMP